MMPSEKQGRVQTVTYTKADDGDPTHPASAGPKVNGVPVLRVEFTYQGETYTHDLPNGDFTVSNPALQFLAFLGVRPSDLDGQRLNIGGRLATPVMRTGEDDYAIHNDALEIGATRLENVVWSPMADHDRDDEHSAPSSGGGGGSDGDGGHPTHGSAEPEARDLPEGVGIEYGGDSRGMTISVE